MIQFYRLYGVVETIDDEWLEREKYGSAYQTRCNIGDEQPLGLVCTILPTVAQHTFVEISRLEEKERHEVVGPLHDLAPPVVVGMATKCHDMQTDHADDTYAAKEVKSVISWFRFVHQLQSYE